MAAPTDLVVKQFWPTTFFSRTWDEHATEAPGIIDFCYALRGRHAVTIASGIAPGATSPYGLYESHFDLFAGDHAGLNNLKPFIGQTLQMAVEHLNGPSGARVRVAVVDSWFHIT